MKKNYFYFLGLCLLSFMQTFAQTEFAPLGAKWTYEGINGWGSAGVEQISKYECTALNSLNGHDVKTITVTHYTQEIIDYGPRTYYRNRDTATQHFEVYQSGDTVYYNNPVFQRFTPLYIFNVQAGDIISVPVTQAGHNYYHDIRDSIMSFTIDSVKMTDYGGTSLKTYYTSSWFDTAIFTMHGNGYIPTSDPLFNWTYGTELRDTLKDASGNPVMDTVMNSPVILFKLLGSYTEVWGGNGNGMLPQKYQFHNGLFDGYIPFVKFNCYENGDTSIVWDPIVSCDTFRYNSPLSIKDNILAKQAQVYPNPAQHSLKIKTNTAMPAKATAYLTDLLGRIVISSVPLKPDTEQVVDVSQLNAGIYILVIEAGGQRGYQKVTIRR